MSPLTATAPPLRAPRQAPSVPPLRVLPARITNTGNGSFATICVVLLTVGLIALLLLNTALAQGSLELSQLQRTSNQLKDTAGSLQEQIDRASASGALAKKAGQLGMVRANERAYIDLESGRVSGTAYPASRLQAFSVVTSPTPVPKPPKPATTPQPATTPKATSPAATGTPTAGATSKPTATKPSKPTTTATATPTGGATPTGTGTAESTTGTTTLGGTD